MTPRRAPTDSPPQVSVLLPIYNAAPTLVRTVESVRAQTYPSWELLAVDDGSTDASAEWLSRVAAEDPRVHLIRRPHQGLVATLNAGLDAARGQFIARLDADDECLPHRLATQVDYLERHPDIGVVGCRVEFGGASAAAGYARHVTWLNGLQTPDDIANARFIESPLAHPSVLFRRGLVVAHGGYHHGDYPEDYELWLRWLEAGIRFAKVPEVLLRWNDPPDRLSRTDPRYAAEAFFRLKAIYLARWLLRHLGHPRRLLIWGAGRLTRRRVDLLRSEGVAIDGYVDIDPRKQGRHRDGRLVLAPEDLPSPEHAFVVGYVGSRGARELQREFLCRRGWVEGRDFLFAA